MEVSEKHHFSHIKIFQNSLGRKESESTCLSLDMLDVSWLLGIKGELSDVQGGV
jgi:hypothetical protein